MEVINDLNLKKQAKEFGVSVWQTPGFLFIVIALIGLVAMSATSIFSRKSFEPEALVIIESIIAALILTAGNFVVRIAEQTIRLNRAKGEFVSVASHQLRTPLSAICWETELFLSKFKKNLTKAQIKNIENINALSNRMTRLVNDLLDVTRIDQKRLILKKESVDMVKIIEEQIGELLSLAKSRNIEIVFSPKKNIPKALGDNSKIKIVVENLLSNSIKYTTNRGKVEIKISKKDDFIITSIKDNGVGIPEEQIDRVFEKFFRSDNAVKYQTDGTGLGLYIAKSIVEQSGGRIWFQSVENLGTIFSFSLPIKK